MKLNTKTKTLKLHNSENRGNTVLLQFKAEDYTLDELKNIFSNKDDIQMMYKFTDDDIFVTCFENYIDIVSVATSKIRTDTLRTDSIVMEDVETDIDIPVEAEINVFEFTLRYIDPLKANVEQNRADIDFLALMTGNDL